MRNCQPGAYYAGAGRWVAEAELRHISVSDHPTTDIRETCTYIIKIRYPLFYPVIVSILLYQSSIFTNFPTIEGISDLAAFS